MIRVVLDTNVLAAAARSDRGASQRLLRLLPDSRFQPAVSVPLFAEYHAVLMRPEHLASRSREAAERFLDLPPVRELSAGSVFPLASHPARSR
jgi:predicted nucleic acid-binding protein